MLWSSSPRKLTRVSKTWEFIVLLAIFQPIVSVKAQLRGHCGGTLYTALLVLSDPVGKSKPTWTHSLYELDFMSHESSWDNKQHLLREQFLSSRGYVFVSCKRYNKLAEAHVAKKSDAKPFTHSCWWRKVPYKMAVIWVKKL